MLKDKVLARVGLLVALSLAAGCGDGQIRELTPGPGQDPGVGDPAGPGDGGSDGMDPDQPDTPEVPAPPVGETLEAPDTGRSAGADGSAGAAGGSAGSGGAPSTGGSVGTAGTGGGPLPSAGTHDIGQLIRAHAAGGIVMVPNGTYIASDVSDFTPSKPLVLVAESEGGVTVTRRQGAQEGETAFLLDRVHDVAFVGFDFVDMTLRIANSSGIHLWYTLHTYPPHNKPRPRHKTCGYGYAPDGIMMSNTQDSRFYGVDFDSIGNDGIKISSVRDTQLVGARFTNISDQQYQTETTDAESASCGHKAGDKFYHSDAIQIYPGDVHDFVVSDSYTERHMMLLVESSNASVSGFQIQNSWLSNPERDCVTLNTQVKQQASGATMELIVVDTTSWCEPKPEKWHFYTRGTTSGHDLMLGNVTYETSKRVPTPTPADDWRAAHPYEAWGCFLREDLGWTELSTICTHGGFPSFRGLLNTPTTEVIHSY